MSLKLDLCIFCNERPVHIKKWGMCNICYNRNYRLGQFKKTHENTLHQRNNLSEKNREIIFIQNFFQHTNWKHHPAIFYLREGRYTPDFYDRERNVFIEVSGTKQAYHNNKNKYAEFRELYPKLNFEIRKPSGEILNESSRKKDWEQ